MRGWEEEVNDIGISRPEIQFSGMRYSFLFVSFRFEFIVNRSKRNTISSLSLEPLYAHPSN